MLARLYDFHNDYHEYDFSALYDVIATYYPVTATERPTEEERVQSAQFQKIGARIEEEFSKPKVYNQKWGKFASALKKKLKKPVSHWPNLAGGGFMVEITLKETKVEDFAHTKTLHLHVSILGPFFTIYGADTSTVFSKLDYTYGPQNGHFITTNVVTISPLYEYEELFKALEKEVRDFFPRYLFVPYRIGMSTIKNISFEENLYNRGMMDTVFEGIFGTQALHNCLPRGDDRYGYKDWLKPMTSTENALHTLMSEHIRNASDDITIHKVWKLKESKPLSTFTKQGNLMFGMELFDVIDLTDPSQAILVSDDERGTIGLSDYTIENGILQYTPLFSFRIGELTKDSLILFVKVDMDEGNVSLKGEIKEMRFEAMVPLS